MLQRSFNDFMKPLSLAGTLSLLGLCSCALSSDKEKEEGLAGGVIPPPNSQLVSENSSPTTTQETLPEILANQEQPNEPKREFDVTESGGFVFDDVLKDLASPSELSTPSTGTPVNLPPPANESSLLQNIDQPVVSNP